MRLGALQGRGGSSPCSREWHFAVLSGAWWLGAVGLLWMCTRQNHALTGGDRARRHLVKGTDALSLSAGRSHPGRTRGEPSAGRKPLHSKEEGFWREGGGQESFPALPMGPGWGWGEEMGSSYCKEMRCSGEANAAHPYAVQLTVFIHMWLSSTGDCCRAKDEWPFSSSPVLSLRKEALMQQ